MSAFAIAMRLATGSIVLRACELGVKFDDLKPSEPLGAIRSISRDPTLKKRVSIEDGRRLTGVELQTAIAERALSTTAAAMYLTEEEATWGVEWLTVLNDLARDPNSCADRLDWVVKQKLINRELDAHAAPGKSASEIAWAKSIDYHLLLPREGAGLKLVRKGFYKYSPTEQQLGGGVPLPQTRAKIRGELMRLLQSTREPGHYSGDWETVKAWNNHIGYTLRLTNPYAYADPRMEAFIEKVA